MLPRAVIVFINIMFIMKCHMSFSYSLRHQFNRLIHIDHHRIVKYKSTLHQSNLILYNTVSTINNDGSNTADSSSVIGITGSTGSSGGNISSKKGNKSSKKSITAAGSDSSTIVSDSITIDEIKQGRLSKIQTMKDAGINPFAYTYDQTHKAIDLQRVYADLSNGSEDANTRVSIAGRIMTRRVFGKLAFFTLQDDTGVIQLYLDKSRMQDDAFNTINTYTDAGDIIGVKGTMKRTDKVVAMLLYTHPSIYPSIDVING